MIDLIDRILYRLGLVRASVHTEMAHRFACVLDYATGGRMSKTNYLKEAMYAEIDDHITALIDEELKARREMQERDDFDFLCDAHKEDDDGLPTS